MTPEDVVVDRPDTRRPWTDRAIEASALGLVGFTPLAFGTVNPWSEAIAQTVILAMVVFWVLGMVREWELRIAVPPGAVPAALFLALALVQAVPLPAWLAHALVPRAVALAREVADFTGTPVGLVSASLAPHATWHQWMKLLTAALFVLVVANTCRSREQVRRLLWAMLVVTALVSIFGIVQRVTWNGRLYWIGPLAPHAHAFGPFVNRTHFAGLVVVVVPMGLAMMLGTRTPRVRRRLLRTWRDRLRAWNSREVGAERAIPLFVLVAAAAALVSGSRGGVISLTAALVAMVSLGARGRGGGRRTAVLSTAVVLSVLAALWIGGDVLYGTAERLSEELGGAGESPRLRLWQDALALWWDAPVIGTGLGSFGAAFGPYRTFTSPFVHTHAESDWVQLLTDTGVIGLALAAAVFAAVGRALLRARRAAASPWERSLALGALIALVGTAAQWIANYNLPVMSNLIYLGAAVAVALPTGEDA